jgi:hypothetical protein
MAPDEIEDFIRSHHWRFAKTMPDMPHAYVVKEKCRDPGEFERFVMLVRQNGYPQLAIASRLYRGTTSPKVKIHKLTRDLNSLWP